MTSLAVLMTIGALCIGSLAGSLSGLMLIKQTTFFNSETSRNIILFPLIRIGTLSVLVFYLLQWGTIPFILFGVSMVVTMWIVILTANH